MRRADKVHRVPSGSPTRKVVKRKKEMTPKSKATRKKSRTEDQVLEDSIQKVERIHVSPVKSEGVNDSVKAILSSFKQKDREVEIHQQLESAEGKEIGVWCHDDELENLPVEELEKLVNDIYRLLHNKHYPVYEAAEFPPPETDGCNWICPSDSCPILADVRTFGFKSLATFVDGMVGRKFDIIMMDPPWQLTTANPTRGVCISYACLKDNAIEALPVPELQTDGFLFIWVINSKLELALNMFDKWGYSLLDKIDWCKMTVNRGIASGHGYYLQHAFETCLIGKKGNLPPGYNEDHGVYDLIYSRRRGQSQKPVEIYEICEEIVKDGLYLEIFGRRNNVRNGWITIGNEL